MRRPAGFFQHLLAREAEPVASLPAQLRGVLAGHDELLHRLEGSGASASGAVLASAVHHAGEGLVHSAALSQRRYLDEDYPGGEALFPANRFDEDRQQVDLREVNSWRLRMHEVVATVAPSCAARPSAVRFTGTDFGSKGSISTIQPNRLGSFGCLTASNRSSNSYQR